MTPRQAFDDVMERSRRLLRLHDGLINTRKRSIRKDWRAKFCKLMHWKCDMEIDRVDSVDAVIVLREGASLTKEDFSRDTMDDLLRAAHVFSVSALDRYVHERVCKGIISAYRNGGLSKEQKDFSIPLTLALEAADSLRVAHKNGKEVRPANEIRKAIQEMLHTRPFQNWRDIEYALKLVGINGLTGKVQNIKGLHDMKAYKAKLGKLVERRHKIVHEGDLPRHARGGHAKKVQIERRFVYDSLNFIEDFVSTLDNIV